MNSFQVFSQRSESRPVSVPLPRASSQPHLGRETQLQEAHHTEARGAESEAA